jgi:hypothetical protein
LLLQTFTLQLNRRHEITLFNFLIQSGQLQTTVRTGRNNELGADIRSLAHYTVGRTLYSGQLVGKHAVGATDQKIDWTLGLSYGNRNEPDFRRVTFARVPTAPGQPEQFAALIPSSRAQAENAGRFFSEVLEAEYLFSSDYTRPWKALGITGKLKVGHLQAFKARNLTARILGYVNPTNNVDATLLPVSQIFATENLGGDGQLQLDEESRPNDRFYAFNQQHTLYASQDLAALDEKLRAVVGLRAEWNRQFVNTRDFGNQPVQLDNRVLSWLPSANLSYKLAPMMALRSAYFYSVNRPELRELTLYSFSTFDFSANIIGNPELQVAGVHNLDLRWEFFPGLDEVVSVSGFYKRFNNPIESIIQLGTGSVSRTYTFANVPGARNVGMELELRKNLAFIDRWAGTRLFQDFRLQFNLAWIDSRVNLVTQDGTPQRNRPLQGQSPYVINAALNYNLTRWGVQANLAYSVYGKRIFIVGQEGYPDIYELPRHVLDLTVSKKLGKHWEARLNLQDMANQFFVYIQDFNADGRFQPDADQLIMRYRPGSLFTLGIHYTPF